MARLLDNAVRTIKTNSILLDMCVLLGREPGDEEVAEFTLRIMDALVDNGYAPDAIGWNGEECLYTLTYRHFVEFAKVADTFRTVVRELAAYMHREEKRRKMNLPKRWSTGMPIGEDPSTKAE